MKNPKGFGLAACLVLLTQAAAWAKAPAPITQLKWWGHAAFELVTPRGTVILIDPWLTNPLSPLPKGQPPGDVLSRVDYILVTHGHFDHVGDAVAIAKKTHATLVTGFELGAVMARVLGYPADQMGIDTLINPGGEITIAGGEVMVAATPAIHASSVDRPDGAATGRPPVAAGAPMGFVVRIQGGPTIYDTGDTAYFSDMKLIGETYHPDLALVNIGGHFGMEPRDAARAAAAIGAKLTIPHHYKTFPALAQDAGPFFALLDKAHLAHRELKPGDVMLFEGAKPRKK